MPIPSRREFLRLTAVPLFAQSQSRPNVIVILTDDQGYGDLGCTGNPIVKTPHLDVFHRQSVRFTDFPPSPRSAIADSRL